MATLYPGIAFSPQAVLTTDITASDTIINVSNISVFPTAPNLATIGVDEGGETILYTGKSGQSLIGCTRAIEGTAKSWKTGEIIGRNFTAKDHNDLISTIQELKDNGGSGGGTVPDNISTTLSTIQTDITNIQNKLTNVNAGDIDLLKTNVATLQTKVAALEGSSGSGASSAEFNELKTKVNSLETQVNSLVANAPTTPITADEITTIWNNAGTNS